MRKLSKANIFVYFLFIILFSAFLATSANAAYIISSLDAQVSPTANVTAKIGDYLLFNMCVLNATTTYNTIAVNTFTTTSIEVYSSNFPASFPGVIFIYDGVHTWMYNGAGYGGNYATPAIKSVVLTDANLIAGTPLGATYNSLQYAIFSAAEGTLGNGGIATVDMGSAILGIQLYDDGLAAHNDIVPVSPFPSFSSPTNDGIYNAKFQVREAYQFNIQNGAVVGHFSTSPGNISAANAPFTSPSRLTIDGIRPTIELVNVNPNPFNPNKELAQFYYYMTENSNITLTVYAGSVTKRALNATGSFGYNQPILWDGLDNSSSVQGDGDYSYRFDYSDSAGNTGISYIGSLKITTVELIASISTVDTHYIHTPSTQLVITLALEIVIRNASKANLTNLGFNYFEAGLTHDYRNYPWIYYDVRLYNGTGGNMYIFPMDSGSQTDSDEFYLDISYPQFIDGLPMTGLYMNPLPVDPCTTTENALYTKEDGVAGDDWDIVFSSPLTDEGGGVFRATPHFSYFTTGTTPGTYMASFKGMLVGKTVMNVSQSEGCGGGFCFGFSDCQQGVTTTTTIGYEYYPYHALPSVFLDPQFGVFGDERGYSLTSPNRTASFIVEPDQTVPLPDNVAPVIVPFSEYPSNNSVITPGTITPGNYVKVSVTDSGIGAGATNLSSMVLRDPYGNQVSGHKAWNAGTPGTRNWELYYIPDSPLTLGGTYTFTVTPVDAALNIGNAVTFSFVVVDTSIPQVSNVDVQSASGAIQSLSASTSTKVTFLVSKIEAILMPGGSGNTAVDWASSSIKVSGVAGVVSHTDGTNVLLFTPNTVLSDGTYTVFVTAVSMNGYQGAYAYNFYISTANITYIDADGNTYENSTTSLRIAQNNPAVSGITDGGGNLNIPAINIGAWLLSSPPTLPSGYAVLARAVSFTAKVPYSMPLSFNATMNTTTMRIHYLAADVNTLTGQGLAESDLTMWKWDTGTWTQLTGTNPPIHSGADYYIELPSVLSIPANNAYALMYALPAATPTPLVPHHFDNTKVFNPTTGPAKIYYITDISQIGAAGWVKAYIYSLAGVLVRTLDSQKTPTLFTGFDTNPANSSDIKYYFTWDGANDKAAPVRNGLYIMKIEIKKSTGAVTSTSRTIAVVK